ncbi:hypothetical protein HPB50_007705 [Hyalomma asiaticum]|uniref:Uncharacterized protein n=1 Tax=Hyalomma asiaticum TaxID=266040 RepID=A0ACB7TDN7_HYAAI|nr:hypothetical protein HPB50_007705 [Hyalomma asiaticum]
MKASARLCSVDFECVYPGRGRAPRSPKFVDFKRRRATLQQRRRRWATERLSTVVCRLQRRQHSTLFLSVNQLFSNLWYHPCIRSPQINQDTRGIASAAIGCFWIGELHLESVRISHQVQTPRSHFKAAGRAMWAPTSVSVAPLIVRGDPAPEVRGGVREARLARPFPVPGRRLAGLQPGAFPAPHCDRALAHILRTAVTTLDALEIVSELLDCERALRAPSHVRSPNLRYFCNSLSYWLYDRIAANTEYLRHTLLHSLLLPGGPICGSVKFRVMAGAGVDIVSKANTAIVDENYAEALNLYNKAVQEDPNNGEVYVKRSHANFKHENWEGVMTDVDKAFEQECKKTAKLLLKKGQALFHLDKYDTAKEILEEGLQLDGAGSDFGLWIEKCSAEIKLIEKAKEAVVVPPAAAKVRHEWYQMERNVTIAIFVKNRKQEAIQAEFTDTTVNFTMKLPSGIDYELSLKLAHPVVGEQTTVKCYQTKRSCDCELLRDGPPQKHWQNGESPPSPLPLVVKGAPWSVLED